jgi:hypothetical protein
MNIGNKYMGLQKAIITLGITKASTFTHDVIAKVVSTPIETTKRYKELLFCFIISKSYFD